MTKDLRRQTADILALRALTLELAEPAMVWGWAMIDAEKFSDGVFALTTLKPPYYWSEVNELIDQIAKEQALIRPEGQDAATQWLAYGHLQDIIASGGEDFYALKLVSRLWFDHETPDLLIFNQLKHAIREVEATGAQGHVEGLTRENWKTMLIDTAQSWLEAHPRPEPFGET